MRSFCFNRILAAVVLMLASMTLFYACGKNSDAAPSNEDDNKTITAAGEQAVVSSLYDDLFNVTVEIGADAGLNNSGGRLAATGGHSEKLGTCLLYDIDDVTPGNWPKTVSVDFGQGCPDDRGRVRSGKIEITFSDYLYNTGATITIKLISYVVNNITVSGTKTITNLSTGTGVKYYTQVRGGLVVMDTLAVSYSCDKTISQTAGAATPLDFSDDVYAGTGTDTVFYASGAMAAVSVNADAPLERKLDCPWIGKGKAFVTVNSATATIDYGNGICDDTARVNIGDKVKVIILPK